MARRIAASVLIAVMSVCVAAPGASAGTVLDGPTRCVKCW